MISARLLAARSSPLLSVTQRTLSSDCAPVQKLRCIFEEYRIQNFSREIPSRFRKEMIKAVASNNDLVQIDSLNRVLINIGRSDQLLSEEELVSLLHEAGSTTRTIPTATLLDLV